MKFSWNIFVFVTLINAFWLAVMLVAQELDKNLPARHSIIPGTRQPFLHLQDFHAVSWGDLFGVTLIVNAFVCAAYEEFAANEATTFIVLAAAAAIFFLRLNIGEQHKPDMHFPAAGQVSWVGILHLPYFGICIAMSAFAAYWVFMGRISGPVMWLGFLGAIIYAAAFATDILTGNFAPLTKITE